MAKYKTSNKRTAVEGELRLSASSAGQDIWTNFDFTVIEYDEKHDSRHSHKFTINREEATRIAEKLTEWLAEKDVNK